MHGWVFPAKAFGSRAYKDDKHFLIMGNAQGVTAWPAVSLRTVDNHCDVLTYKVTNQVYPVVQYASWAELFYIQLISPRAAFLGHVGGILAGLFHVYIVPRFRLPGLADAHIPWLSQPRAYSGRPGFARRGRPDRHAAMQVTFAPAHCDVEYFYCMLWKCAK